MPRGLMFVAMLFAATASTAAAQDLLDCSRAYESMLQKIERQTQQLAPERLLALRRRAQRILEACRTGHIEDPRSLFDRLDRSKD
jgi:hypothetical protein